MEMVWAYEDSGLTYKEIVGKASGRLRWILMDTWRMEQQLGLPRSSGKTPGGWHRRHDDLVRRVNKQRIETASDEQFVEPRVEVVDGYTFTRLCSERDYLHEGSEMRHCIGSYASYAQSGEYMAFKVEGRGERATLGLRIRSNGYIDLDQLHGARNALVAGCVHEASASLFYTFWKENSMIVMQTAGHCV
jgi:hypothetical protein